MRVPYANENGDAKKVLIGMSQYKLAIIDAYVPSQLVVSLANVVPSDSLIFISYEVILDPPL